VPPRGIVPLPPCRGPVQVMGVAFCRMWPGLPLRVFSTQICFFSRPVCPGYYEKSREICVFWSDKLSSNFCVFNNIKITLHYSVYMRTSGEKARISDEAECVQSVSYSHIRSLSGLYTVVFKGRQARHLPRDLLCNCNVQSSLPCFQMGPNSNCNVK